MLRLGVDFGTSNTAAVLRFPDGSIKPLLIDGSEIMPSAVCLDDAGALVAGRDAVHAGHTRPEAFEPHPKRCVDDGEVHLSYRAEPHAAQPTDVVVPVTDLIGAVLARVAAEARRIAGRDPDAVTLTCPASWGTSRRDTLPTTGTGRIHAVIVLSDGANDFPTDDNLDALLEDLNRTTDDPVPVFTIADGSDADRTTLGRIARAARGETYDATNATTITEIMSEVLANF